MTAALEISQEKTLQQFLFWSATAIIGFCWITGGVASHAFSGSTVHHLI